MSNLLLEQVFGIGVTQDIDKITIQKSSLKITLLSQNTAESLLVAILVKAIEAFRGEVTDNNGNKVTDISGNFITYDQTLLYELLDVFLWKIRYEKQFKIYQIVILENDFNVD